MSLETIPYFYIIEHMPSGKLYGGSRWVKGCNPDEFMVEGGYHTSSYIVNELITEDGVDSFKIILILTDFGYGMTAYEYETVFLQSNDIANNENWLNKHNNDGYFNSSFGSEEFKNKMLMLYSVDNPMKIEKIKESHKTTLLKNYNVINPSQSLIIRDRIKLTLLRKTGVDHPSKTTNRKHELSVKFKNDTFYNDGIKNHRVENGKEPDLSWEIGALPKRKRTQEEKNKNKLIMLGSKVYNDGIRNYQVLLGETPDPSWNLGKIRIKEYTQNKNTGNVIYNDGIKNYYVKPGEIPEPHWIRGMKPRTKK